MIIVGKYWRDFGLVKIGKKPPPKSSTNEIVHPQIPSVRWIFILFILNLAKVQKFNLQLGSWNR